MPGPSRPAAKLTPLPVVGPSPITPDCRYLFVVDTSAAMQRSAEGLYRATHRLIATGVGNRMQEGDIFTVWTYADTVLTREFPLNAWTRDLNVALANRTYEFLVQQKFHGKSNLRPVFAELGQALAIATNLTVILVSDGTDVVVGTPFDRAINVLYGKRASEMRAAKMPFLTALVTHHGEFTHWAVRGGLEDIALPFPEPPLLPVPVLATAVVTPPPTPIPVVFTPPPPSKPTVTTNAVPQPAPPVIAKAPETVVPKPAPTPPPVAAPAPKPVTNALASVTPAPPPTTVPLVVTPKPAEPVPPPAPKKPEVTPPLPLPVPAPAPAVVKPKETLVVPVIPPVVPTVTVPARYQPQSVIDASNALAKVQLLRPSAATSAPPVARPVPTLLPVVPLPAPATNRVPPTAPLPKVEARVETKVPVAVPAPTAAAPKPMATGAKKLSPAPQPPAPPTGPLAVASGPTRRGGWLYLAAALGLLAVAGGIIAHLLRPPAQPSAISRSLDDQRG